MPCWYVENGCWPASRSSIGCRGLPGRKVIDGALLWLPARSIHTIGMESSVDIAHLDSELVVLRATTIARNRVGVPVPAARAVLEAPSGSFGRWGLFEGDELEVRS